MKRCFIKSKSKEKEKGRRCRKHFKQEQNNKFTIIHCRRYIFQGYKTTYQVICMMNFLAKVVKKNVRIGLLLFIKILLKTTQLFYKLFPVSLPLSLCLCVCVCVSFISFLKKAKILLQLFSQKFIILYMFSPFSFIFINALITSTSTKIVLQISFFH